MRKVIIGIAAMMFANSCKAQVPGYQGKRLSVGYSLSLSPCFINPNTNGKQSFNSPFDFKLDNVKKQFLSFNSLHGLQIEYVLGTSTSIGVVGEFFKTNVQGEFNTVTKKDSISFGDIDHYGTNRLLKVEGKGFDIYLKRFKGNYIAPYGRYFRIDLVYYSTLTEYEDVDFIYQYGSSSGKQKVNYPKANTQNAYHYIYFGGSVGKQRIFYDKFITDLGIRGLITTNFFGNGQANVQNDMFPDLSSYLYNNTLYRMNRLALLNVYLKVSFLAF